MSDAATPQKAEAESATPPARKGGRGLGRLQTARAESDDDGTAVWTKVLAMLRSINRRGEIGRVIERWQVTTLSDLRDVIDAAIAISNEAGVAEVGLEPMDVILANYPRDEGRSFQMSINKPFGTVREG